MGEYEEEKEDGKVKDTKPVVYEILFSCGRHYIGETKRRIEIKSEEALDEH